MRGLSEQRARRLAADLAVDFTYDNTTSNVTVNVIDTGIRKSHSEFEGRARSGRTRASSRPRTSEVTTRSRSPPSWVRTLRGRTPEGRSSGSGNAGVGGCVVRLLLGLSSVAAFTYWLVRALCLHRDWRTAGTSFWKCHYGTTLLTECLEVL